MTQAVQTSYFNTIEKILKRKKYQMKGQKKIPQMKQSFKKVLIKNSPNEKITDEKV